MFLIEKFAFISFFASIVRQGVTLFEYVFCERTLCQSNIFYVLLFTTFHNVE
jgi:hypothetical protein